MVDVGVLLTVTVTIDITPYCYLPIGVLTSPEAKHSGFPTYLNAMNTASRYMPSARERGVVQKPLAPGYTERRQSRAGQGIPHLECYPDLNHAKEPLQPSVHGGDLRTAIDASRQPRQADGSGCQDAGDQPAEGFAS